MSLRRIVGIVFAGTFIVAGVACSSGDQPSRGDDDFTSPRSTKKKTTGDDEGTSGSSQPSGSPSSPGSTPSSTSDAGAATDAATPATDAGSKPQAFTCNQVTATTCAQARTAGSIIGDGNGTSTSLMGAGSQWISVRVNEDSFSTESLGITATLTSPEGSAFDVYLYDGGCTKLIASPYGPADMAEAYAEWNDTAIIDNSKTILVEVRHVSGTCTEQAQWTLDLVGGVIL